MSKAKRLAARILRTMLRSASESSTIRTRVGIFARMQISTSFCVSPALAGIGSTPSVVFRARAAARCGYKDQRCRPLGTRGLDHGRLAGVVQFRIQYADIHPAFAQHGFGGRGIACFEIDRNRRHCAAPSRHMSSCRDAAATNNMRSETRSPLINSRPRGPAKPGRTQGASLPFINTGEEFAVPQK